MGLAAMPSSYLLLLSLSCLLSFFFFPLTSTASTSSIMKRNVALVATCAASLVVAAPAPFPAPSPEPMHAVGSSASSLLSMFDDADLIAVSDTLGKRDAAPAALLPRHPAAFDASGNSKKSMRFSMSKKRHETGRSTKRFTRRQAAGNNGTAVDDESELLNYLDIRSVGPSCR